MVGGDWMLFQSRHFDDERQNPKIFTDQSFL